MEKRFELLLTIRDLSDNESWNEKYEVTLSELVDAYGRDLVAGFNANKLKVEGEREYLEGECIRIVEE